MRLARAGPGGRGRIPATYYDRVIEHRSAKLEPHVVGPHSPDRARPISQLAAEIVGSDEQLVDAISTALIGSCTNSSYEDMSRAADVAEQAKAHGIKAAVPFLVTPGLRAGPRHDRARRPDGSRSRTIGATVLANACGPCIGQWRRAQDVAAAVPNTIVTSYNRNFPSRNDGQPTTMNFIASPEIVTALALAGGSRSIPRRDTLDRRRRRSRSVSTRRSPPPRCRRTASRPGHARVHRATGRRQRRSSLTVDPNSERLQLMQPWPAWDGKDFLDLPVLIKTQGKTTTDHISPAGPWLRYRGHLDKFSDNMFMGATNAFTGEAGTGINVLTGEKGQRSARSPATTRRRRQQWVVVGDCQLRRGQQPRARRAVAAPPGRRGDHRPQLRAHPRDAI